MRHQSPTPPTHLLAQRHCVVAALFLLLLVPRLAVAEDAPSPGVDPAFDGYSDAWTGAFVGLGARGGASWLASPFTEKSQLGWAFNVDVRISAVLSLVEAELDYGLAGHDFGETSVLHHTFGAFLNLHPLFLVNLGSDALWYAIAAFYLQAGLSLDLITRDGATRDLGYGTHFGVGLDFPVTDPDDGGALWLGVLYRYALTQVDLGPPFDTDFSTHTLSLSIAYRNNGLLF